ncbi:putative metalloprotease CJM1_0395 family protein [Marinimicrobium alkaliphilum]|uniref:putative metalloprotease CJM1_0395 family protein n=1 Tax=Marinimicrobium alkaliphilum TaxID=2202654 RepID=UPI000DBA4CEC|nr:putative metalloprotease CJM1_0395 family protein [Marinimicrobium alkaliphilum]
MIPSVPLTGYSASAITPYTPAGGQPVGLETPDQRPTTLKPLEQSAESARQENYRSPDERNGQDSERERLKERQREQEQQRERQEREQIRELAARDREVRAHEQAHAAAGGRYTGAPSYQTVRGPDGVSYAVAGEVPIDTSEIPDDPEATIEKAQQIRRAAYAPVEPSDQDRRVAMEAMRMEQQARAELSRREREEVVEQEQERIEKREARAEAEAERKAQEQAREERRNELMGESVQRNMDINRRLVEIGITTGSAPGAFFDQHA